MHLSSSLAIASAIALIACGAEPPSHKDAPPTSKVRPDAERAAGAKGNAPELQLLMAKKPKPDEPPRKPVQKSPQLPAPRWDVELPQKPELKDGSGFRVEVLSSYLTGECPGEGKKKSKGIRWEATGKVWSPPSGLFHRATLTGMLYAKFGPETVFLRASNGRGFEVEVTSDKPWRPGLAREFKVKSRYIDPIYCELDSSVTEASLHLAAKRPVGGKVDAVVWTAPIPWAGIRGLRTNRKALVRANTKIEGPYFAARAEKGTQLTVRALSKARALVRHGDSLGWLALDDLDVEPTEQKAEPRPGQVSWVHDNLTVSLAKLSAETKPRKGVQRLIVTAEATIKNSGSAPQRCRVMDLVLVASGSIEAEATSNEVFDGNCKAKVKIGQTITGDIEFDLPAWVEPLAVGWRRGTATLVTVTR